MLRLGKGGRLDEKVDWNKVGKEEMHLFQCQECILGKGRRLTSPTSSLRANRPNSAIHVDLWGPAPIASIGGHRYFLTCYDDYSRKISLTFLKKKSEAAAALIKYINLVENQLDLNVKTIRSDRGGEFEARQLKSYLETKGIEHMEIPPAAHAQNGRVERAHLTILNTVRTLLLESKLPDQFWAEAAYYAVYARNRAPSGPSKEIPEDLWRNYPVSISHQRPFGSNVFYRDHVETNKLRPRYRPGRLLSYEEGTVNYRIWDIERQKVTVSRDAVFEARSDNPNLDNSPSNNTHLSQNIPAVSQTTEEDSEEEEITGTAVETVPEAVVPVEPRRNPRREARPTGSLSVRDLARTATQAEPPVPVPAIPTEAPRPAPRQRIVVVEIPTRNWANVEAEEQEVETDQESVEARNNGSETPDPIALYGHALISTGTPDTFRAARQSPEWPEWEKAIKAELEKMAQYQVWEEVPRTEGMRVVIHASLATIHSCT